MYYHLTFLPIYTFVMKIGSQCYAEFPNKHGGYSPYKAKVIGQCGKYTNVQFEAGGDTVLIHKSDVHRKILRHDPSAPTHVRTKGPQPRCVGMPYIPADTQCCAVQGTEGYIDGEWFCHSEGAVRASEYDFGTVKSVRLVKSKHDLPHTIVTL